jgi:Raf kinase inhibitor-like YbhB/YbcL family protein
MTMRLDSPAFSDGGEIPPAYTCDDEDRAPPLVWSGVPDNAQSLVLIVDDPDAPDPAAPKRVWVHWVVYNLAPSLNGLNGALPGDSLEGLNDWKQTGYRGPCPPIGRHRYFFKLYALDTQLPEIHHATKGKIEQAMAGHVLAQAQLIGRYQH